MCSEYIPYDEIISQGLSFTDSDRLFKWNGTLFRGIPSERASFCRNLFNKGIMQELITKKLFVETEITPLKIDRYEIVLKHRTIPFVSYPQEWCDMMLKDAALHQLDFCLELDSYDLRSADSHPLNILFDECQPVFVDFGSIEPIPTDGSYLAWHRYEQFSRVFIRPLRLMAKGHDRIARWLLHDYELGILKTDIDALMYGLGWNMTRNMISRLKSSVWLHLPLPIRNIINEVRMLWRHSIQKSSNHLQSRRTFLKQIHKEVESIKLTSTQLKTPDSSDGSTPILPSENRTSICSAVSKVLSDIRPSSVLNIGRNIHGTDIPLLAARYGSQVVAVNPDETNVRNLYAVAKRNCFPVLPLQINFFSPSYDLSNYWFKPASERLRCDLVLALDLINQLVIEEYRFDLIAQRLSALSNHWLLVDFTPNNDWESNIVKTARESWYTLDSLMNELAKWFRSVNKISSQSEHRVLLLCEK
ncbi:MAG: hypothetical protein GY795_21635 [Desulfobacterales bacterium]|nr:hypothetical protein [Desulfobacterales bacterium]